MEEFVGLHFDKRVALVTFHPVTMENNTAEIQIKELLRACDNCKDTKFIFTKAKAMISQKQMVVEVSFLMFIVMLIIIIIVFG